MECIRLANFTYCDLDSCPWRDAESFSPHLLVNISEVDFVDGDAAPGDNDINAIAISYAWGDFDRESRLLGHEREGNPINITLGAEWNQNTFMRTLVQLSRHNNKNSSCWIDQICMPKEKDAVVRRILASIPSIYRRLEVVVLLPGSPCKCLAERFELLKAAVAQRNVQNIQAAYDLAMKNAMRCMNMFGCSSWFSRTWTRQELMYARRIKSCWTGIEPDMIATPCVRIVAVNDGFGEISLDQPGSLMPYSRLLYNEIYRETYQKLFPSSAQDESVFQQCWRQGNTEPVFNAVPRLAERFASTISTSSFFQQEAFTAARAKSQELLDRLENMKTRWDLAASRSGAGTVIGVQSNYLTAAAAALAEYLADSRPDRTMGSSPGAGLPMLMFFAGETLINRNPDPRSLSEEGKMNMFLQGLGRLRSSARTATQQRDYCNSIWTDCPRFHIPANFKNFELKDLLQNAMDQLQTYHSLTLLTSAPAGLFGASNRSGLWHPTTYLIQSNITRTCDAYSVLLRPFKPVPVTDNGFIPLRKTLNDAIPFSASAFDFETQFCSLLSATAFDIMVNIMKNWPEDVIERCNLITPVREITVELERDGKGRAIASRAMWEIVKGSASSASQSVLTGQPWNRQRLSETHVAAKAALEEDKQRRSMENKFRNSLFEAARNRHSEQEALTWDSNKEVSYFDVIRKLVMDVLGLDHDVCKRTGLRLVISPDPPSIGFARKDVFALKEKLGNLYNDKIKTACIMQGHSSSGSTFYELEKNKSSNCGFTVFGVWVPMMAEPWPSERVFAVAEAGAHDAFIS